MNADDVRALLRKEITRARSQQRWADQHGLMQSLVSETLRGNRSLPPQLLKALGLEKVVSYRKLNVRAQDAKE